MACANANRLALEQTGLRMIWLMQTGLRLSGCSWGKTGRTANEDDSLASQWSEEVPSHSCAHIQWDIPGTELEGRFGRTCTNRAFAGSTVVDAISDGDGVDPEAAQAILASHSAKSGFSGMWAGDGPYASLSTLHFRRLFDQNRLCWVEFQRVLRCVTRLRVLHISLVEWINVDGGYSTVLLEYLEELCIVCNSSYSIIPIACLDAPALNVLALRFFHVPVRAFIASFAGLLSVARDVTLQVSSLHLADFSDFLDALPCLQKLDISRCPSTTLEALLMLVDQGDFACPTLEELVTSDEFESEDVESLFSEDVTVGRGFVLYQKLAPVGRDVKSRTNMRIAGVCSFPLYHSCPPRHTMPLELEPSDTLCLPCPLSLKRHALRTKISALEAQIARLESERMHALLDMRTICHINRFPSELLLAVFSHALGPEFPSTWSAEQTMSLNTFLHVCAWWRSVLREAPAAWRVLAVYGGSSQPGRFRPNAAFERHVMLHRRLPLSGSGTVSVVVGATPSYMPYDYGIVPVLAIHSVRLERLSLSVRATALWRLGDHLLSLQWLKLVLRGRGACWQAFCAPKLSSVSVTNACGVADLLLTFPWSGLTALELVGKESELCPGTLLAIFERAPALTECTAVFCQRNDPYRECDPVEYRLTTVVMPVLEKLVLEIVPMPAESWDRLEEPFLDLLALPAIQRLVFPELWMVPDALLTLEALQARSRRFPAKVGLTAVPPWQRVRLLEVYSARFPYADFTCRKSFIDMVDRYRGVQWYD
ncbi:hypothetical protein C8R45DRAFT_935529 [Mycena sanguinolenta]|nr:hypothetical protein C8R45DRAFT_935529 [Mycena sanguinolenta]